MAVLCVLMIATVVAFLYVGWYVGGGHGDPFVYWWRSRREGR